MSYSVGEVAKKLHLSTTAIYKKLELPEFKDLVIVENGRKTISAELLERLESSFKTKVSEPKSTVDETLNKVIETLSNQLAEKDRQIAELLQIQQNQQTLQLRLHQSQEEVKMIDEPKKKSFWFWNR